MPYSPGRLDRWTTLHHITGSRARPALLRRCRRWRPRASRSGAMTSGISQQPPGFFWHPSLSIESIEGRGRGVVALADIDAATLLVSEQPFTWDSGTDAELPDLLPAVEYVLANRLDEELACGTEPGRGGDTGDSGGSHGQQHGMAMELAESTTKRIERARSCVSTCCFRNATCEDDGHYESYLFRYVSRFNHSCFPEAGGLSPFHESLGPQFSGWLRFFALVPIAAGTEICISYLPRDLNLGTRDARVAELEESKGFTCTCARCAHNGARRSLDSTLGAVPADAELAARIDTEFARSCVPGGPEFIQPPSPLHAIVGLELFWRRYIGALGAAHVKVQHVRSQLLSLITAVFSPELPAKWLAKVLAVLVEDMEVEDAILPTLSPGKVTTYLRYCHLITPLPDVERHKHCSDVDHHHPDHVLAFRLHTGRGGP